MVRLKLTFGFLIVSLVSLQIPRAVLAENFGAGVGLGSIQVDQVLAPGGVYKLPDLPVVNTGDAEGEFITAVSLPAEYLSQFGDYERARRQEWLKRWISFSPSKISLAKGESKPVGVKLFLPTSAPAGDYFFYLEASPAVRNTPSNVNIGPVAAAKLYFTVGNSPGVLGAFRQRASGLWNLYQPWTGLTIVALDIIFVLVLLKGLFSFSFSFKRKKREDKP